jgi:hypothetical protein
MIKEVKDVSLLYGTLQNLLSAKDLDAILKVLQHGMQIIFNAQNALFFLYDRKKDALIAQNISGDKRFSDIHNQVVPLHIKQSLLTTSLRQAQPIDSFGRPEDQPSAIIDEQIGRLMGKEGMVCFPMIAHGEHVGVILVGIDQAELSHLLSCLKPLTMFADQAALALYGDYHRRNRLETIQEEVLPLNETVDINQLLLDIVSIIKESLQKDSNIKIQLSFDSSVPAVAVEKNGIELKKELAPRKNKGLNRGLYLNLEVKIDK